MRSKILILVVIDKSSGVTSTCLLNGFQLRKGGKSDDAYAHLQICSMSTSTLSDAES